MPPGLLPPYPRSQQRREPAHESHTTQTEARHPATPGTHQRREELCRLKVKDIHSRRGVPHLRVHGKGNKTRYIPLHAGAQVLLNDYLDESRHAADTEGALFRPVINNRTGRVDHSITPDGVYKLVRRYALGLGLKIGAHALRATAATNALDHDADITKVQEWLGHANIATTRIYDRRRMKAEESPTFKISY
jgi:site-specific recombinase XerD